MTKGMPNLRRKEMNCPKIIKDKFNDHDNTLFGVTAVLSPPIANFVKEAGIY